MPKKAQLTKEDINNIILLYQTEISSTHKLAEKFKVGHKKISQILKENNITINSKGAQFTNGISSEIEKSKTTLYNSDDLNKKLIAKCKKTGIEFEDANNLSGCLTRHIIEIYGDVPMPTNTYQRKKYELLTDKKWFEEYFDIIEQDKKDIIYCKCCNWETEDIENKTGALTKHIQSLHNLSVSEYIEKFSDQEYLWSVSINFNKKLNNESEHVICLECNKPFLGLTETHMIKEHNITLFDYKKKWGDDVIIFSNKTIKNLSDLAIDTNKNMVYKFISKPQEEIANYIKNELNLNVQLSNKKELNGVELDIFIPELKIAIEYNGLYWHTEKMGKHKNYHLDKTILSSNKGIKLIHIFEDEWKNKKDIVKSRLNNLFNQNKNNKIYARNCVIKEIDSKTKDIFLNETHIQGTDKSSIRLGAYYEDKLVGVMTFSKLRKVIGHINKIENEYELVRFASNSVIGLPSKLLTYFIKNYNPKRIITFADRRWSPIKEDCLYGKIGFNFISETKPNYWYTKNYKNREHRFNYRKDILVSKGYDITKTESEIMLELGYSKIWDCGSFKYELIP